jgi:hypothetical protein
MKLAITKKVLFVPELGSNMFCILAVTHLGWKVIFSVTKVHMLSEKGIDDG